MVYCSPAIGSCLVVVFILVGLLASLFAIKHEQIYGIPTTIPCPTLEAEKFTAREDFVNWFNWNWRYFGGNNVGVSRYTAPSSFVIKQRCPSIEHNAELWIGGIFSGRTEAAHVSKTGNIRILDCHGELLFTYQAKSWGVRANNKLMEGIHGSYQLMNSSGSLAAYIEGDYLFHDDTRILGLNGGEVARIYNTEFEVIPEWKFEIKSPDHPAGSAVVLALIAGQQGFAKRKKLTCASGHECKDVCNGYWQGVSMFFLTVFGLLCFPVVWFSCRVCQYFLGGCHREKNPMLLLVHKDDHYI
jgi:hypothetical protein